MLASQCVPNPHSSDANNNLPHYQSLANQTTNMFADSKIYGGDESLQTKGAFGHRT